MAAVVHKEEEITIRLHDFASVRDDEMTAIRLALEDPSETRDKITIHTYSLTAVKILNNRKLDLIQLRGLSETRHPDKHRGQLLTAYPPILEYRVTRKKTRLQIEAYNSIEYTLQLTQALSEYKKR